MLPPGPPLRVDDLVAPNANPVMRAAGPLLQLLGRLRVALMRASFASLMEQVADAIKFFEKDIRSAGISEHQANTAKYILCATADDIVQHIPTEERHVWTQYSMLSRFFWRACRRRPFL
ncbi:type IV/VI secretion system ImpK/VasF family protein [Bradyrhizobium sp. LB7.2]